MDEPSLVLTLDKGSRPGAGGDVNEARLAAPTLPEWAAALALRSLPAWDLRWGFDVGIVTQPGLKWVRAVLTGRRLSVVGGGDSAAAVRRVGFDELAFGHIWTGGGAWLEYLEGQSLPGLDVLG